MPPLSQPSQHFPVQCRRKLQQTFEENPQNNSATPKSHDRSVLSVLSFNENTRKLFRSTTERFTKTFNTVRTTFGTISQKFKVSTKRRQILEEGPMTPHTPHSFTRQILGRTPTKLYSPFGIETPHNVNTKNKENN